MKKKDVTKKNIPTSPVLVVLEPMFCFLPNKTSSYYKKQKKNKKTRILAELASEFHNITKINNMVLAKIDNELQEEIKSQEFNVKCIEKMPFNNKLKGFNFLVAFTEFLYIKDIEMINNYRDESFKTLKNQKKIIIESLQWIKTEHSYNTGIVAYCKWLLKKIRKI